MNGVSLFQELLELAQRKFLRQIANYSSGDAGTYPRIIIIDYWKEEEKELQQKALEAKIETNREEKPVERSEEECERDYAEQVEYMKTRLRTIMNGHFKLKLEDHNMEDLDCKMKSKLDESHVPGQSYKDLCSKCGASVTEGHDDCPMKDGEDMGDTFLKWLLQEEGLVTEEACEQKIPPDPNMEKYRKEIEKENREKKMESSNPTDDPFADFEKYDGPGNEFCVRLLCEADQVGI